ncbi:ATP-dependent Clp protease ATP-binding subunit [Paractinoplanes durhamensis]|uniref:ATPase AAA n=1 Tax=Paractinoplanes durhamensis TaxID=113563 RepID=A0ABQ3YSN2_9ACTN|nr:ATP-dependent Clp protease ATP-binding subunit [Actinoplanes durhamensis]GIE00547.1 ATPase AAA [Actinoplanes durhamensis]
MSIGPIGPGGPGNWDDLFARFFGAAEPRRQQRIDITKYMSGDAREVLSAAARRAAELADPDRTIADLDTDHLLWGALQQDAMKHTVRRAGADPESLLAALGRPAGVRENPPEQVALTPQAKRALLDSLQISRALGSSYVGPEHILMALGLNPDSAAGRLLAGKLDPQALQGGEPQAPARTPTSSNGKTPTLEQYGVDLTEMARRGELDPVIGRADEIEQAVEILSRRTKNNPVLIGEAGVGKTAVVEGLAQRIVDGDVPLTLEGKRVIQLDLAGLVAGTRYRGDFEERLRKVIDEIQSEGDGLIVFLDEIHTLVGAGGGGDGGGMDASNMLKPALARGQLRVVGATTLDEYRKYIEKDAALARRFQPVHIGEPSAEDTVAILRGLRDNYEAHHQVRITDEALDAAAELSDRYITDRFLPDKAIDLIDQAGARVRLRVKTPSADTRDDERRLEQLSRDRDQAVAAEEYEKASALRDEMNEIRARLEQALQPADGIPQVTGADIAEVVSRATGIPVSQLTEEEKERLLRLEGHLHDRVVGQDDAVEAVAEAVRRSRAGLGDPGRPVGSFLFLGPTGVGKTELARSLADALFGDSDRMIRLDMSEFQERHTVSRLVGAPPGYVGYDEAGQLTEAVRRRPYSVVLLDEIEKAHPDVFNILLQVLDDGRLTDSQGRTVSFKNTVLIMTSNIGSDLISGTRRSVGFGTGSAGAANEELRDRLDRRLKEQLRPEFINRIDEIIVFRQLETDQLRQITELMLQETRRRLEAQGIALEITTEAVDWLADKGFQPEFGARPLRRTIQRELDNRLSKLLLGSDLIAGQTVKVDVVDGKLSFQV